MSGKKYEVKIMERYCKGCGLCVDVCNQNKIHMNSEPNKAGIHTATLDEGIDCTGCRQCATICPDAAIEIYRLEEVNSGSDPTD